MCQKYHNTLFLDDIMKFEYFMLNKQLTGWIQKRFFINYSYCSFLQEHYPFSI